MQKWAAHALFGKCRNVHLRRGLIVIDATRDEFLHVLSLFGADKQVSALCAAFHLEKLVKLENPAFAAQVALGAFVEYCLLWSVQAGPHDSRHAE